MVMVFGNSFWAGETRLVSLKLAQWKKKKRNLARRLDPGVLEKLLPWCLLGTKPDARPDRQKIRSDQIGSNRAWSCLPLVCWREGMLSSLFGPVSGHTSATGGRVLSLQLEGQGSASRSSNLSDHMPGRSLLSE